jgi:hypothetical protein
VHPSTLINVVKSLAGVALVIGFQDLDLAISGALLEE